MPATGVRVPLGVVSGKSLSGDANGCLLLTGQAFTSISAIGVPVRRYVRSRFYGSSGRRTKLEDRQAFGRQIMWPLVRRNPPQAFILDAKLLLEQGHELPELIVLSRES